MRRTHNSKKEEGFALMMVLWTSALLGVFLLILTDRVHTGYQIARMNREIEPLNVNSRNGFYRMAEFLAKEFELANGFNQKEKPFKGLFKIDLESWKIHWLSNTIEGDLKHDDELKLFAFISVLDSKFPLSLINRDVLIKIEGLESDIIEQILSLNLNDGKSTNTKNSKSKKSKYSLNDIRYQVRSENSAWFNGTKETHQDDNENESKNAFKFLFTEYSDGKIYLEDASWEILRLIPGVDDVAAKEAENSIKQGRRIKKISDLKQVFGISKSSLKGFKKMVKLKPSFFKIIIITQRGQFNKKLEGVIEVTKSGFKTLALR